jgi:S-adenosylmethionine:diacylglycerol 3-amino-3-carboxypropyl transferase
LENPPFRSQITYSVQNEDYRTELAVLQHIDGGAPLRVLMIASSGENVLSLLTSAQVASVDAVDLNPAQLHLCELRRTALEHVTRDEQLRLFGAHPAFPRAGDTAERVALFDRIRLFLSEDARSYWDARHDEEIAFGVHHVGRNDICMHDICVRLCAAGFDPLGRPLEDADLPAWKAVYTDLMTADYIRQLFGLPSEALAARIASIAGIIGECHFRALQQPHAARNPFLTTVFAGAYATTAGEDGLPLYLQQEGQAALQRLGTRARLRLHAGNMLEQMAALASTYGPYDMISISNIADWMTAEQFAATVTSARGCLAPGGALLARTATGSPMIVNVMGQHMAMDNAFNDELLRVERGPWFRTIAVGFHPV